MNIELQVLTQEYEAQFKRDIQTAFQNGAEKEYGKTDEQILPEADINKSLTQEGSIAYKALSNGELVGGAIIIINEESGHNSLDFLYVKDNVQSKGIGQQIWAAIEGLHPNTKVWETVTPYFEKRNIHFYINRLGFHAVEFFNPRHKDPNIPDDMVGGDYFFRFEKKMQ